jgi:hypothetical protein
MKQGWAFAWRSLMAAEIYVTILTGFGLGHLLHYSRELMRWTKLWASCSSSSSSVCSRTTFCFRRGNALCIGGGAQGESEQRFGGLKGRTSAEIKIQRAWKAAPGETKMSLLFQRQHTRPLVSCYVPPVTICLVDVAVDIVLETS